MKKRLQFLVNEHDESIKKEMEISVQAGELVGLLYDELLKQYINPENEESLKSLNQLCVRLVFCLYAEDAGIFGSRNKFHDYMSSFEVRDTRRALIDRFKILNTKPEDREPYLDERLAEFPYVNGGLFADESIEISQLNEKIISLLLERASESFDWNEGVAKNELNYIMGNPPFVGYSLQTKEQKQDILSIYVDEKRKPYKTAGKIDYVSGRFFKASEMMNGTSVRTAFVCHNFNAV